MSIPTFGPLKLAVYAAPNFVNYYWSPFENNGGASRRTPADQDININHPKWIADNTSSGDSVDSSAKIEDRTDNNKNVDALGARISIRSNDGNTATGLNKIAEFRPYGVEDKGNEYTISFDDIDKLRMQCCLGQLRGGICGDYTPGSGICETKMPEICSQRYADPAMGDMCTVDYCPFNPDKCLIGQQNGWCYGKMDDQRCKSYCLQGDINCDPAVFDYCKDNNSDFCGCINDVKNAPDTPEGRKIRSMAPCVGLICSNPERNAYRMKGDSWNQDVGCTSIDCDQISIVQGDQISINSQSMNQECHTNYPVSDAEKYDPNYKPGSDTDELSQNAIIGISVGAVLFVMLIVVLIVVLIAKKKAAEVASQVVGPQYGQSPYWRQPYRQ